MSDLVVSIDIGTSSVKAAAISGGGEVVARSRRKLRMRGGQRVAGEWAVTVEKLLADMSDQAGSQKIDALCISGNGPTLVGGDGCGDTLTWDSAIEYAGDTGDTGDTGSLFIPRIKAFRDIYPQAWKESRFIYSGPEYIIHTLTGADLTILPEDRYSTAYWTSESLRRAGFTEQEAAKLPPFVKPGACAGKLQKNITPTVLSGVPVYCGAPDFISAMVGTNTLEPGLLCDRAGSSEGINFCSDTPLEGAEVRTLPSIVPGLWNVSALLPESGTRFSQFKAQVEQQRGGDISYEELVHTCIYNPGQVAVFDQGKYLMLQTAMQVRDSLTKLLALAADKNQKIPDRMTVTGGQAANDEWNQMKANVTGMTILVPGCSDAELVGDAVFAFTGMGLFSSVQDGARAFHSVAKCFEPEAF